MEGAMTRALCQDSGLGKFFSQRLVLWFDDVSTDDKKGLEQLLDSYYPLKEEVSLTASEEGDSLVCYGKKCLPYQFYDEYQQEEHNFFSASEKKMGKLRVSFSHEENLTLKDAKAMKNFIQSTSESRAHYEYLNYLGQCLKESSGARLWVTDGSECYGPHLTKAPERYGEEFKPVITELVLFPPRQEVMQGLMGFLMQRKAEYETPRHLEIMEGILRGEIKEYLGNAREEFSHKTKETETKMIALIKS